MEITYSLLGSEKRKYYCDQESSLAFPGLSFCLKFLKGCIVNWRVLTSEWIKLEIDQSLIHIVEYFKSQYKMLVIAVRGKKRCLHSFQSKAWSHGNNLQLYETTAIMWMSFNIATTAATPLKKVYWMIISTTGRRGEECSWPHWDGVQSTGLYFLDLID